MRPRYWIWDKSERWFYKAESLANRGHFEAALNCFQEAIRTDPQYAHLHIYQALTLAELARFGEALNSCDRAEQIDPSNDFFLVCRAAILLDSGDANSAIQVLERASKLGSPKSLEYSLLAKWDLGDKTAFEDLTKRIRGVSLDIASRLAVRVEERIGPSSDEGIHEVRVSWAARMLPEWLRVTLDRRHHRRFQRRVAIVDRLLKIQKTQAAMWLLESTPFATASERTTWNRLHRLVIEAQCKHLRDNIKRLEQEQRTGGPHGKKKKQNAMKRREYLMQLATSLSRIGQEAKAYDICESWIKDYRADDSPVEERSAASNVMIEMAAIDINRKEFERAARYCRDARSLGVTNSDARINLIEGLAELARGDRLASRRHFEKHLSTDPSYLKRRLAFSEPDL